MGNRCTEGSGMCDKFLTISSKGALGDVQREVDLEEEFKLKGVHFLSRNTSNLCIVLVIVKTVIKELSSDHDSGHKKSMNIQ